MAPIGDHLVVVRPNYATNIETPRTIGCRISCLDLKFENGFDVDLNRLVHDRLSYRAGVSRQDDVHVVLRIMLALTLRRRRLRGWVCR